MLPLFPLPPKREGQNKSSWSSRGSTGGLESRLGWCLAAVACSAPLLMGLSLLARVQVVPAQLRWAREPERGYARNLEKLRLEGSMEVSSPTSSCQRWGRLLLALSSHSENLQGGDSTTYGHLPQCSTALKMTCNHGADKQRAKEEGSALLMGEIMLKQQCTSTQDPTSLLLCHQDPQPPDHHHPRHGQNMSCAGRCP